MKLLENLNKFVRIFLRPDIVLAGAVSGTLIGLFAVALLQHQRSANAATGVLQPIAVFPDFASISDVEVKKQMFFDFLELYVSQQNQKVETQRQQLQELSDAIETGGALSGPEIDTLEQIASLYNMSSDDGNSDEIVSELLKRVDTIPVSLALAQAANESAWGTSRFALEANNIFGQWCYEQGCGIVPRRRAKNATHEVRSFENVEASVKAYFTNLNTHSRYEEFREMRYEMRNKRGKVDPMVLAYGLSGYSERGEHYVDEVQTIMQQNNLTIKDQI